MATLCPTCVQVLWVLNRQVGGAHLRESIKALGIVVVCTTTRPKYYYICLHTTLMINLNQESGGWRALTGKPQGPRDHSPHVHEQWQRSRISCSCEVKNAKSECRSDSHVTRSIFALRESWHTWLCYAERYCSHTNFVTRFFQNVTLTYRLQMLHYIHGQDTAQYQLEPQQMLKYSVGWQATAQQGAVTTCTRFV